MASLKQLSKVRGGDVLFFDPNTIEEIPGYNVRNMESEETIKHIEQMKNAIVVNGIMSFPPITISQKDGQIFVYSGHCRLRAHKQAIAEGAEIKGIRCIINSQSDEERTLDLITSNEGLPLTPIEKAEAVKRLLNLGWTKKEVASKIGCTLQTVYNMLKLDNAPTEIKKMVSNGEVSATTAMETLDKEKEKAPEKLKIEIENAKSKGKKKATYKTINEGEVKNCPFCGGKAKEGNMGEWRVFHKTKCFLVSIGITLEDENKNYNLLVEDDFKKWNKRSK